MFGWLAARSSPLSRQDAPAVMVRRSVRMAPRALCRRLPTLGNVLYVHASGYAAQAGSVLPPRLLTLQTAFAPLLDTHWLIATSVVTDDGPREWIEALDRQGQPCARLHLLPDTDYLGWDALLHAGDASGCLPVAVNASAWRPDHASVLAFSLRRLAGIDVLDRDQAPLSPLGGHIATRIAHAEAVALH